MLSWKPKAKAAMIYCTFPHAAACNLNCDGRDSYAPVYVYATPEYQITLRSHRAAIAFQNYGTVYQVEVTSMSRSLSSVKYYGGKSFAGQAHANRHQNRSSSILLNVSWSIVTSIIHLSDGCNTPMRCEKWAGWWLAGWRKQNATECSDGLVMTSWHHLFSLLSCLSEENTRNGGSITSGWTACGFYEGGWKGFIAVRAFVANPYKLHKTVVFV